MGAPAAVVARHFWAERVQRTPDAPYLTWGDQTWTFASLDRWVHSLAHGLVAAGVQAGSRTAVLMPNSAQLVRAYLALMQLGATIVPLLPKAPPGDIAFTLGHSGATSVLTDRAGCDLLAAVGSALPQMHRVIVLDELDPAGGPRLPAELIPQAAVESGHTHPVPDPRRSPRDPLAIIYTSGSTARPKGVVLPESSFGATGTAAAGRIGITSRDTMYCVLPLCHCGGTHLAWATTIAAGCRFVLAERFSARAFWPAVRAAGATHVNLVPGMVAILNRALPAPSDRDHPLRVSIGATLDRQFVERFGVEMVMTWSMTETAAMGTMTTPLREHPDPRVAGRPLAPVGETAVRDPQGNPCPPGQTGEIWCRHEHVMTGYLDNEAATAATLVDGWVRSGDLGVMDADGALYFRGRLKNLIKRLGENVSGDEVEHVLGTHPDVVECLVLGVADPVRTEEVYAVLVTDLGSGLDAAAAVDWCRAHGLAEWKLPRYLRLQAAELPRLVNGKLDRAAVVRAVAEHDVLDREQGIIIRGSALSDQFGAGQSVPTGRLELPQPAATAKTRKAFLLAVITGVDEPATALIN
jgi:crotonobetaine/carnitine-CoA ligase